MAGGRKSTITPGDRFGRLLVIDREGRLSVSPRRTVFRCRCDCGKEKLIDAGNLKKGSIQSCGCYRRELARLKGKRPRTNEAFLRDCYQSTRKSAKDRGHGFEISLEYFVGIVSNPCFYCGCLPQQKLKARVGLASPAHGVDRVDNNIGYVYGNCVACCSSCNYAKHTSTVGEFFEHVYRIVAYQNDKEKLHAK